MKKLLIVFIAFIVMALAFVVGGFIWWNGISDAPGSDSSSRRFLITKGSSAQTIGDNLEGGGLVKSSFAFKLYLSFKGLATKIPSGEYRVAANLSISELVDKLLEGPTEVWVTIPEGLRREQVALKIANDLNLEGSQYDSFVQEFLRLSSQSEGFLFPDTYLFPKDVTPSIVFNKLRSTFDSKVESITLRGVKSNLSLVEVVTLASLIERETLATNERPIVAGILMKRLVADWPLQADASIQYAVATARCGGMIDCEWWPKSLTRDDLEINSSYNSYKFQGLPPGPIANPGLTSLAAAFNYEDSDYWFYIHDSSGKIYYAETLEQHNSNIGKYLGK